MPHSTQFDDIYYSRENALKESKHVFIEGTGLDELWKEENRKSQTIVAELGFGGGLNFLNTWAEWRTHKPIPDRLSRLHYTALEKHPLSTEQLKMLYKRWPSLNIYCEKLLSRLPGIHRGLLRISLEQDVCLDLVIEDAHSFLNNRLLGDPKVDAWFLDGFSPRKNPDLWDTELFRLVATHSHPQTRVATYSSAGFVRRNLEEAGFKVERADGFGGKRHMLKASDLHSPKELPNRENWFETPTEIPEQTSAVVIGAGLAGCLTAYALACRGWQVDILDSQAEVASGASGISQLALRCRLFNEANPHASFYLQAYSYAVALYSQLGIQNTNVFHPTGLLQAASALNKKSLLRPEAIDQLYPPEIVSLNDTGDYWFQNGGWADSSELCNHLINHELINFRPNTSIHSLNRSDGLWQLLDSEQKLICETSTLVLANGPAANGFLQSKHLPLQTSYGQSSQFAGPTLSGLNHVICADKSIFPGYNGMHTVSATYRDANESKKIHRDDDAKNQRSLEAMLDLSADSVALKKSQIGARCQSRDRFPVVGLLPDFLVMKDDFAELSRNAKAEVNKQGSYLDGLYINTGHGSNGLSSCPLSGEYLASLICGESSPLNTQTITAIHPARFLIQDLKKQRV